MPGSLRKLNLSTPAALILALVFPVFAVAPLFYPGFIQTHTGFVPLWNMIHLQAASGRLSEALAVVSAEPLVNNGLLFYYLAGLLPFSPVVSIKLLVIGSWLLGSAGMFMWLRSWLGNPGALAAALVYVYLPYPIMTVYVRGAWGEVLFWGLLPWAILTATFLVSLLPKNLTAENTENAEREKEKSLRASRPRRLILFRLFMAVVAVIFWLLLGLSQPGLAFWALLFLILLLLLVHFQQSLWPILSAGVGVAGAMSVYAFLIDFPSPSTINFSDHFLYPFQLFSSFWGGGASRPGWDDGLSLQVGLAGLGLALVSVILWQRSTTISRTDRRLLFFSGAAIGFILLVLGVAPIVWNLPLWPGLTLAGTLTYPWQLLGFIGLCVAVLSGAALWIEERLAQLPIFSAIILLIVLSSYSYLQPQFIQPDPYLRSSPQAILGHRQMALLDHDFAVLTAGATAGLERGQTTVPLAVYGPLQPGDVLVVKVVWQPLQPLSQNFKMFVHLVDPAGVVVAQYDGYPQSGDHPTPGWVPGELIEDSYPVLLPADAPPGPYQLYLGFYNETTLERLPVPNDAEGRVILDVN